MTASLLTAARVREVLVAARGKIAQGWCQGAFARGESRCVIGAVLDALGERVPKIGHYFSPSKECDEVLALLTAANERKWVGRFNDDPTTTQADILAIFDRALRSLGGE